jgi:hypothetical protein
MAFPHMRLFLRMRQAKEVNRMRWFTSLWREDGETLAYEVVTLALVIFAIFGALSLFHRL